MTQVKMRYIMGTLVTFHRNSLPSLIDQFSNPMICRKTSVMFYRVFPLDYLFVETSCDTTQLQMIEEMHEDRSGWDRAWSSMAHREILAWHAATVDAIIENDPKKPVGVIRVTISEDPTEFADRCHRPIALCPICGSDTSTQNRVAASLHPTLDLGPRLGTRPIATYAVWTHAGCLNQCPSISHPTPIPW